MYSAKFDFNKSKRSHPSDFRLMALNHLSEPNKKPVLSGLPFHPVNLRQLEKEG
jgi:hypothetical protein